MKSFVALCLALVVCAAAAPAVQARPDWGPLGHYMSAAIAQGYLSDNATNACANLLPDVDGDIAAIASWADTTARDLYPWSPQLHYINTPDWDCTYEQSRDCVGGDDGAPMACVDGAIQNYTSILVNDDVSDEQMTEALMFLVHFIGDVHQPLHVGFTGDEGGNTEYGDFLQNTDRRLHQIWDDDILDYRIADDFNNDNSTYLQYYMNELQSGKFAGNVTAWRKCTNPNEPNEACSIEWAKESVVLACSTAYTDQDGNQIQDGFNLQQPYMDFALPVVEMQIAKGGIRMAHVLNSIFAEDKFAKYVVPREQFLANKAKEEAEKQKQQHQAPKKIILTEA